ncbi:MAG: Flp pilus assembly complex ATPase component TadA [Ilumatobacteraceae bacterium]|nr:Flp pilus assembly complex ATPase component TadA [Ilumatobacteraceae bacterium]
MSATPVDDRLLDELCRLAEREPGRVDEVVRRHVGRVAPLLDHDDRQRLEHAAVARLAGLDVLDRFVRDPAVTEVLVNGDGQVWAETSGELRCVGHLAAATVLVVIERVLAPLGRRLDRTSPIVDARLPDGSRVCAVAPPVAVDGPLLSIRRLPAEPMPLVAFAAAPVTTLLADVVAARCNVVVAGATSSGKTSLLAALLAGLPSGERVVVLEDTAELPLPSVTHRVRLECRPASTDGPRAIDLAELVRTAMRLRPDRLVVGEIRGAEVLALVQALNTGHDGSFSTCHANGAVDALHRLESLVLQAAPAWPLEAVRHHLLRAIDVVVVVERGVGGRRRVAEVVEVVADRPPGASPSVRPLASGGRVVADLRRRRA